MIRRIPKILGLSLIRLYQLCLSPLLGKNCRYLPTCSHYTAEAIEKHGLWAGMWMGLARLSRCHPLGSSGFDPVPEKLPAQARWYRAWAYGKWRLGSDNTPGK